jgi:hypothetical protein
MCRDGMDVGEGLLWRAQKVVLPEMKSGLAPTSYSVAAWVGLSGQMEPLQVVGGDL